MKAKTLGESFSWRDPLNEKDLQSLNDLIGTTSLSFEKYIEKHASSIDFDNSNPSKIASVASIVCKKILTNDNYGLNDDQRSQVGNVIYQLLRYKLAVEAHKKNTLPASEKNYTFNDNGLTLRDLFDQIKNLTESESNREELIKAALKKTGSMPEESHLGSKQEIKEALMKDFGLEGLPKEDQGEMLLEVAKSIQKQFLFDVYSQIGEKSFEALDSSAKMGTEFYTTTLKHLVPNYEEIFLEARKKVVKAFNSN